MRKVNYKSDFDFIMRLKDASGKDVPWPDCDWDILFWTSSKPNAYRASCIGGECVNCFRESDGSIHFVFDNHRMGKGTLHWEPHFRFPNDIYPDGIQDQFRKAQLGIELVDGDGDEVPDTPDVEVYMPAVYLTAYDLAVRNGYTGTYEDYVAYTNRFPQIVESAETVNALLSDFADGKAMIADALTRQGVATTSDESMQTMADKVLGLQLAVEGDPHYVEHDSRVGGYDLYNVMHNHRKAEFPYMYAVSFNAPMVTLSGADAYLCSDGYFTEESGTHKMPFAQEHYVIYYFRNKSFALTATASRYINNMCVYNGAPIVNFDRVSVFSLSIYGDEPFATDNVNAFRIAGGYFKDIAVETLEEGCIHIDGVGLSSLLLPNLKTLRDGFLTNHLDYIQSLMLPSLTMLYGGLVASTCAALAELSLPSLQSITGGTIVNNAASLAELSLPALETVWSTNQFNVCWNCDKVSRVSLPRAKMFSTPGARGTNRLIIERTSQHITFELPVCEIFSASFSSGTTANTLCELHFGAAIYAIYTECRSTQTLIIKIGKGAVTFLDSGNANWDTEALKQLLADLGDNTGGDTKQIRIGASQIAKLTDEDIAMAVAKNYSLS